jgi:autotransporter-associated beta strand protein
LVRSTSAAPGILALTGANSYSGGTNVLAGTLQIARDANIGRSNRRVAGGFGQLRWTAAFDLAATDRSLSARGARPSTPTASAARSASASAGRVD